MVKSVGSGPKGDLKFPGTERKLAKREKSVDTLSKEKILKNSNGPTKIQKTVVMRTRSASRAMQKILEKIRIGFTTLDSNTLKAVIDDINQPSEEIQNELQNQLRALLQRPSTDATPQLLDPRLVFIVQLHRFAVLKNSNWVADFLDNPEFRSVLPRVLLERKKSETLSHVLDNLLPLVKLPTAQKMERRIGSKQMHKIRLRVEGKKLTVSAIKNREGVTELYRKVRLLGVGSYKTVKKNVPLTTSTALAQGKMKDVSNANSEGMIKEAEISRDLRSNGVPNILDIWSVKYKGEIRNMMELCDVGDLSHIRSLPIEKRMALGRQLAQAIASMHKLGVCHLDLKQVNAFVKRDGEKLSLRLGDFGAARYVKEGKTWMCSSYPAPEMARNYLNNKTQTDILPTLDLWALGDILHCLKFGFSLLDKYKLNHSMVEEERKGQGSFTQAIKKMTQEIDERLGGSADPLDWCIGCLLEEDPNHRPRAETVVERIDEWLKTPVQY